MTTQHVDQVEVTATIAAPPVEVYRLISDVTRMGEGSPETTSCRWTAGAQGPRPGAQFRGSNRMGVRRWSTRCSVTTAEEDPAGSRFAFAVQAGPVPISEWAYEIEPADGGCRVTESWVDRRPTWMRIVSGRLMGVPDRSAHNREGMRSTLAALKAAAEGA
jgi:hypothetical protein